MVAFGQRSAITPRLHAADPQDVWLPYIDCVQADKFTERQGAIFPFAHGDGYPRLVTEELVSLEVVVVDRLFKPVDVQLAGRFRQCQRFGYFHSLICIHHDGYVIAHCFADISEEHTSELQSRENLVCRLLLEKKNDYIGTI